MAATPRDDAGAVPSIDELRLVWLLAEGRTDEFVAARLGCTRRTLQRRLRHILEKLGADSRFQAGVLAERAGWLSAASETTDAHSRQPSRKESELSAPNQNEEPGRPPQGQA